jgi:hypothetical protein
MVQIETQVGYDKGIYKLVKVLPSVLLVLALNKTRTQARLVQSETRVG